MPSDGLWKYCTSDDCKELLLSLSLFGRSNWSGEKQIAALYALSRHTKDHYSQVIIPKRDGRSRRLLVPDALLKSVQRSILYQILDRVPVSRYAMAYRHQTNVVLNARAHIGQKQLLKLDIEDFFGSISFPMVYSHAFPAIYFPPSVRTLLTHLCCYQDYLPQGAPTSAAISNLVMKSFDEYIGPWCEERDICYTRYCDDMVFSGNGFNVIEVKNKVQNFLQAMGFYLNQRKTKVLNQSHQQLVTGLVVNEKVQVPLEYRKKLRQEIYFCKKFGVVSHLERMKAKAYLPAAEGCVERYLSSLSGKINFVLQANPEDKFFQNAKKLCRQWGFNK